MTVSPFVPSLADISQFESASTRQCIWSIAKRRKDGSLQQCTRTIGWSGQIHEEVLSLIAGSPEPIDKVDVLDKLSRLLLCGRSHRKEKYIGAVLGIWKKERERNVTGSSPLPKAQNVPSVSIDCPTTTSPPSETSNAQLKISTTPRARLPPTDIRHLLQIEDNDDLRCHRGTLNQPDCRNHINKANQLRINAIITSLANLAVPSREPRALLHELSLLLFCVRFHRHLATEKEASWAELIPILCQTEDNSTHPVFQPDSLPTTPKPTKPSRPATTPDSDSPSSAVSSIWSRSAKDFWTPPTTPSPKSDQRGSQIVSPLGHRASKSSVPRAGSTNLNLSDDLDSTKGSAKQSKTFRVTRSHPENLGGALIKATLPSFVPYYANSIEKLRDMILKGLTKKEQDGGWIYGFRRTCERHIKIGYTNDVNRRLDEWRKQCKYEPQLVFKIAVPYAYRVEKLVQLTLATERRREPLVNGRCNAGNGCQKVHKEWFEVLAERCTASH